MKGMVQSTSHRITTTFAATRRGTEKEQRSEAAACRLWDCLRKCAFRERQVFAEVRYIGSDARRKVASDRSSHRKKSSPHDVDGHYG